MTILLPQTGEIPKPQPSMLSRPYWEGCVRGELLIQRCASCDRSMPAPAPVCRWCLTPTLVWKASAGEGVVYSYSIVWRPQTPAFVTPYVPAIVELREGVQILSNIIGCEPDDVHVGMAVAVEFHPIGDGAVLPYFRPTAQ
ncbi:Zn-ribbon domain-containing OB-fold protein [Parasphingorhabdus sp.]|uniref:Zn-ribbon domain-containing OB-fold protein n=1 Tax=Parasphingorhabdus sp. TaxID=2709688 RepID=UPI003A8FC3B4